MITVLLELVDNNEEFKKQVTIKHLKLKADTHFIQQGQPHSSIFIIKKGTVRVISETESSEENEPVVNPGLSDLNEDELVGEFCLFDDAPASATVTTVEDSELIEIEKK